MTTVGYGDITPVSVPEIIFAVIEMMGGAAMFAYIVGNMASLVMSPALFPGPSTFFHTPHNLEYFPRSF